MPTQWQTIQVPLASGLSQRSDDRASNPPTLAVAKDIRFTEVGGIQTRYPFATVGSPISSGTIRRVYANGDELLAFTEDTLWSYTAEADTWVNRGTHLAIHTSETTRFDNPTDQVDPDRAELNGLIVYAWVSTTTNTTWLAAVDKTTGATVVAPTDLAVAYTRPRLVALSSKILLFLANGSNLKVCALDPAAPSAITSLPGLKNAYAATMNAAAPYYDVVKIPGADTACVVATRNGSASYDIGKVTASLTVTTSNKGRTCDGPIAVSVDPTGATAQVVRGNGTNIQGDRITVSSLADAATGQAVGTGLGTINQIACAHRSTQDSGAYRAYAFWSSSESTSSFDWLCKYNWVDTGGTLGTQATFRRRTGVASRAFSYNGHVYLWLGWGMPASVSLTSTASYFSYSLQNTYFLYRDDGLLCAKAAPGKAEGHRRSTACLAGVALTDGSTTYSWCGTERRRISLGGTNQDGYANRAPRDITITFDSNEARRVARLGKTLYIATGEGVMQYDGVKITELGYHIFPWELEAIDAAGGSVTAGDHAIKGTWAWQNAAGELDRSASSIAGLFTSTSGRIDSTNPVAAARCLNHTHKTTDAPAIELWRTTVSPTADSPFYLTTSKDPAVSSNPNRYLANDDTGDLTATFYDDMSDATMSTKEINPENGGALESLQALPCSIIIASDTRLFVAGCAGDPDRVWYSKTRNDGEVAAFHDALTIAVPPLGGDITALALLNDTLIVFRETAVYMLPGEGFDNLGNGQNYGPARLLAQDVGAVSQEGVAVTPEGVVFKSSKGWYLLNRGWSTQYIGAPVSDYDSDTVNAVHILESKHEIRCLTSGRVLVLDTQTGQWAEWTISDGYGACIWQGTYAYGDSSLHVLKEQSDYSATFHGMQVETAWIKLNDLQGAGRVRAIQALGEYRGPHQLRIQIAYNYDPTFVDDKYWTVSPTVVGGPLQVRMGPSRQVCEAIKVRITAVNFTTVDSPPTSEALKLTGLALEVGVKPTMWRRLPAAQRQ